MPFKMEGLLDVCTHNELEFRSFARTIVIFPGFFFDHIYWYSRITVFCCASPVHTGITQNRLLHLAAAPREGCGSSPRMHWVLELCRKGYMLPDYCYIPATRWSKILICRSGDINKMIKR